MLDILNASPQGQIKLHQLAVFNWGSFQGLHLVDINENGTFIVGNNGSGKSTLSDALMVLLISPSRVNFNIAAAQDSKGDRSLMSYVRGSFGSENDGGRSQSKNKRNKATLSAIQAIYKHESGDYISLMALFWITGSSLQNADIHKLYMITHQNIALKSVIDEFGKHKTGFKKWLDSNHIHHTEKFSEYQALYSRSLHLKPNAPALLNRALGLKKVDNLTELIRTLVLEPNDDIKEKAKEIVKEFSDLKTTYEKLIDVKEQLEHLKELPDLSTNLIQVDKDIHRVQKLQENLTIFMAKMHHDELLNSKNQIEKNHQRINENIREQEQKIELCHESISRYQLEYSQAGGDKIAELERQIKSLGIELARLTQNASNYQEICRKLSLSGRLEHAIFWQNQQQYETQTREYNDELLSLQNDYDNINFEHKTIKNKIDDLFNDINTIEKSKSNIRPNFQKVRGQLCQALNLSDDDVPFVGELLDVKDDEKGWQGAIERALGGLTNTLLVGQSNYKQVTNWLNQTHTGLHIRVQVVGEGSYHHDKLHNGFLDKIKTKSHPYADWLMKFLSHYDLQCLDNVALAQITPFSMTIEGLIQKEKGRFEKNDKHNIHDRRYWQLGFSNQSLLAVLKSELNQCQNHEKELARQSVVYSTQMSETRNKLNQWEDLSKIQWYDIDIMPTKLQKEEVEKSHQQLLLASGHIDQLKSLLEQEKQNLSILKDEFNSFLKEETRIKIQLESVEKALVDIEILVQQEIDDDIKYELNSYYQDVLYLKKFDKMELILSQKLESEFKNHTEKKSKIENTIYRIISSFSGKEKWHYLTVEWRNDLSGIDDYLTYYEQLKNEKLADFEQQFKQKLTTQSTQSLASFHQDMKEINNEIKSRIQKINEVLQRTEFRQHSFLRIKARSDRYPYNIEFDKKMNETLVNLSNDNHEKRYQLLGQVVAMLEKATNPATTNTQESLRLLEPRYQLSFTAEEIHADGRVLDELNSSSGKSGGEKESFAGMIMAASLAYVLTPDGSDKPVYCTVFLDEAFSNTQESVSLRVLKVFKDLHIHINLITPYKNINLAREVANSLIICEKNNEHESRLCEITWEQLDDYLNEQRKNIDDYGIEVVP